MVALRGGAHAGNTKTIQLIGEAKTHRLDIDALERLDRLSDLLAERSGVALSPTAKRLLFSTRGFTPQLAATARTRPDVELIDLTRLYQGD